MEAREHFEAAAAALAAAEAPGVSPEQRDDYWRSMRYHRDLAYLARDLGAAACMQTTPAPSPNASPAVVPSTAPTEQATPTTPWAWITANRSDLLEFLGQLGHVVVGIALVITIIAVHHLAATGGQHR